MTKFGDRLAFALSTLTEGYVLLAVECGIRHSSRGRPAAWCVARRVCHRLLSLSCAARLADIADCCSTTPC